MAYVEPCANTKVKMCGKKWSPTILLMEDIQLTSWYCKYPIIYRVFYILSMFFFVFSQGKFLCDFFVTSTWQWFRSQQFLAAKRLHGENDGLRGTPSRYLENNNQAHMLHWLVVSTHPENISQIGSFPQVGMKIENIWNHHLVHVSGQITMFHQPLISLE